MGRAPQTTHLSLLIKSSLISRLRWFHLGNRRQQEGRASLRNLYKTLTSSLRAIQDCDQALKLDSHDALTYYRRGLSPQKKAEKSGGKADIAKSKQLDSKVDQQ